jgi:hypothetical protein
MVSVLMVDSGGTGGAGEDGDGGDGSDSGNEDYDSVMRSRGEMR